MILDFPSHAAPDGSCPSICQFPHCPCAVLGATGEAALIGYRQGRSAAPQRGFPRRLLDANDGGATDVFSIFGFPLLGKGADGWGQAAAPAAPAQQLQAPAPAAPEPAGGKPLFTVNW